MNVFVVFSASQIYNQETKKEAKKIVYTFYGLD
jgi:hypothetical protein